MFCRQTRRRVSNIELNNSEIIGTNLWDDPTRSSFTYLLILLKFIFSYFNNFKKTFLSFIDDDQPTIVTYIKCRIA